MSEKIKNISIVILISSLILTISLCCILKAPDDFSQSERRMLAQFPKANADSILNGHFMSEYETYAADQFPCRERFRAAKAASELYLFNKLDSNGLFISNGHISKIDYPLNDKSLDNAAEKLNQIYESCLKNTDVNIYLSIIPDKNYFISEENKIPLIDYKTLADKMREKTPYMKYIEIYDLLCKDDYYETDTHWKQECIIDIADYLAEEMGADLKGDEFISPFETKELSKPFYGVYYGQLGVPHKPDKIKYLENDTLEKCITISYASGSPKETVIYNIEKANGKDPYELFLSGSEPLITIENPYAKTDRELVLFRDSFGSSIAPLMMNNYSKITLVDIRYIHKSAIENLIDFNDQDVLFLYSTNILNNSFSFRAY